MRICIIEGCDNQHDAKGWCSKHYKENTRDKRKEYLHKNAAILKIKRKQYHEKNRDYFLQCQKVYSRTLNGRYNKARSSAYLRGLCWELTLNQYQQYIQQSCYYCNGKLGTVNVGTGLDRIDNAIGYKNNNVLSCCSICNTTRSCNFTIEETKAMITTVLDLRTNKDTS